MNRNKIINTKGREISTDICLHPGEVLLDELEARSSRKNEFAGKLNIKASHFSELLHGKRNIGAALAIKLEAQLSIPAEYWLRLQVYYDLFVERQKNDLQTPKRRRTSVRKGKKLIVPG